VLPDVKMLNEIKRFELASADLAIAGMWIAEDDGVLNPTTVKVGPRKIIVANSVNSMKPLQSGANFQLSMALVEKLQAAIRKGMMADQLQPQDGPAMTATEVHVRVELIRKLLGPVYGRFMSEYLKPLVERSFGLAYRAGVFGPAPESLRNRELTVRYISPIARAQKLEDVQAMDRLESSLMAEAQMDPTILDLYDFEQAVRERSDALGVPSKVLRTKEDVEARRAERQAQQEAAQKAQQQQAIQQVAGQEMVKRAASGV
jgi:hypothetical protein